VSTRYSIVLIPEPSFTARAYRARQLICGQYACWAAEMHMVHLALTDYFPCPEDRVAALSAGLDTVAQQNRNRYERLTLFHKGVTTSADLPGHIYLDFTVGPYTRQSSPQWNVLALRNDVMAMLGQVHGADPAPQTTQAPQSSNEDFQPKIYLMQHARLPETVFESAVDFAREVAHQLEIPDNTHAWRLMLVRFQSAAAGDDWSNGRWATDLSWNIVSAHPV